MKFICVYIIKKNLIEKVRPTFLFFPEASFALFHPTHLKLTLHFLSTALLLSTILLSILLVDCAQNRPCRPAFSIPTRSGPPPMRPPTCWCPLEAPGLSCASCPAQSGPWQGGASLWNHTSQLFTLSLRHPTPMQLLCSAPRPASPCLYFTPNVNGSFLEEVEREETRKQLQDGRVLLDFGVPAAVTAGLGVTAEAKCDFYAISMYD